MSEGGLYELGSPPTSERMRIYAERAPKLALAAIRKLNADLSRGVTHLVTFAARPTLALVRSAIGLRKRFSLLVPVQLDALGWPSFRIAAVM